MANKPKSVFQLKMQTKIQHLLLELFSKSEMTLNNEKILLSITDVDISPDLKNLKIFIDILNIDKTNKVKIVKKLNKDNVGSIKKMLAEKVNLKFVPEVLFILDESNEKLFRMNEILEKENKFFSSNLDSNS